MKKRNKGKQQWKKNKYHVKMYHFRCFSCASSEYRTIFERGDVLSRTARMPQFDQLCDIPELVQGKAPVESCQSSLLTEIYLKYCCYVYTRFYSNITDHC
uniref:40S ribosomal protein S26 n=1 Tax=Heterorhabditis bacteriophora TaxID=37862 RepID=A0A1I7WYG3_HETBA